MTTTDSPARDITGLVTTVKKDLVWLLISTGIAVGAGLIANLLLNIK